MKGGGMFINEEDLKGFADSEWVPGGDHSAAAITLKAQCQNRLSEKLKVCLTELAGEIARNGDNNSDTGEDTPADQTRREIRQSCIDFYTLSQAGGNAEEALNNLQQKISGVNAPKTLIPLLKEAFICRFLRARVEYKRRMEEGLPEFKEDESLTYQTPCLHDNNTFIDLFYHINTVSTFNVDLGLHMSAGYSFDGLYALQGFSELCERERGALTEGAVVDPKGKVRSKQMRVALQEASGSNLSTAKKSGGEGL
jgi:hypothetical protein